MDHRHFSLALTLVGACVAPPAAALEGGSVDSNASPTFAGVASLLRSGAGVYSAVLISPTAALTAAHVVAGVPAEQVTLQFNLDSLQRTATVSRIEVAPGFTGFQNNGEITFNDLAVLQLTAPVLAEVPHYALLRVPLSSGVGITLVGYGGTGASVKREGTNTVDALFAPSAGAPAAAFVYDYDAGLETEATVVGGDSGSPAFVRVGDEWEIAGINTFAWQGVTEPGVGSVRGGGGMIVSAYAAWIDQAAPVPEPATWALLAAGLGLVGLQRRRLKPEAR